MKNKILYFFLISFCSASIKASQKKNNISKKVFTTAVVACLVTDGQKQEFCDFYCEKNQQKALKDAMFEGEEQKSKEKSIANKFFQFQKSYKKNRQVKGQVKFFGIKDTPHQQCKGY